MKTFFRYPPIFVGLILSFLIPNVSLAQGSSTHKHILWEAVSPQQDTAYFVGTVHLAKPDLYPLDSIYDEVLKKSDALVFEVHLDSLMADSQRLLPKMGFYQKNENLKDYITEELYQALNAKSKSLGIPFSMLTQMKPWVAALTLTSMELQKAGYTTEGIDMYLFNKGKQNNKEMFGLETTKFQLSFFDDMSNEAQIKILELSLKSATANIESIDTIMKFWKRGKPEALNKTMNSEMDEYSDEMTDQLLYQRNKNWVPKIQKILDQHKTPMVIVGVGHLVGKNSVLNLLEKEGFKVTQR